MFPVLGGSLAVQAMLMQSKVLVAFTGLFIFSLDLDIGNGSSPFTASPSSVRHGSNSAHLFVVIDFNSRAVSGDPASSFEWRTESAK